ncbi:MAG: single-stranded DNA-binding protein [bacterium]|nr:single-stranded DNA-binding protein [bacterium]
MLNKVMLVAKMLDDIKEIKKTDDGIKYAQMKIGIPKSSTAKITEDNSFVVHCVLFEDVIKNMDKKCKKGAIIGIEGKLGSTSDSELVLVLDKVILLAQREMTNKKTNKDVAR